MHDLTGFQRDLLIVIAALGGKHGLRIKEELEQYYGKDVNHGRLYPNLDELASKGLVKKGHKNRRTNAYRLTKRGVREIEDRKEWESQYFDRRELTA